MSDRFTVRPIGKHQRHRDAHLGGFMHAGKYVGVHYSPDTQEIVFRPRYGRDPVSVPLMEVFEAILRQPKLPGL